MAKIIPHHTKATLEAMKDLTIEMLRAFVMIPHCLMSSGLNFCMAFLGMRRTVLLGTGTVRNASSHRMHFIFISLLSTHLLAFFGIPFGAAY